jgi:glyoxylase-like metal-dependent hydrolase (beta-lactamase superfamily II)
MVSLDDTSLSRRRFLWSVGAAGASLWMGQRVTVAPAPRPSAPEGPVERLRRAGLTDRIRVAPLRDNLSCISGCGGNIVVLVEPEEVLLVDSGLAGARVAAAVASLSSAPITHLVNSHWHFDHTGGNARLAEDGGLILAHENTRRHLSRSTCVADFDFTFPAVPATGLPDIVFDQRYPLEVGRTGLLLRYYGAAHTDSDISVRFPHADVLHVADTWWNGLYPFIDYSTGGSIDGLIAATRWNLVAADPTTLIVPGQGPVGRLADLQPYYDMLVTVRDRVAQLKRRGLALREVIAAKPTASFDGSWGGGLIGPEFFTRLVYQGV